MAKITGTFIDEITCDIGSQNWSEEDWKRDFEAMAFIGIDTVIIIRGAYKDQAVFPSKVVGNHGDPDNAIVWLDEAAKHNMKLYFGTYCQDQNAVTNERSTAGEISANLEFIDEVVSRYWGHPAFTGWYICHEVCKHEEGINNLFKQIAVHAKEQTPNAPALISPYYPSEILLGKDALPPAEFGESWRQILNGLTGLVDVMAFQDGTAPRALLPAYLAEAKRIGNEHGIELWNNVETFDRGMSYFFPPRDIRVLRKALEVAEPYVRKTITFEFSHFMSPNSCFPGAANLYRRYCEVMLGMKSPF